MILNLFCRLKFAPIFGWQWFIEYSVYLGFPFTNNEGICGGVSYIAYTHRAM